MPRQKKTAVAPNKPPNVLLVPQGTFDPKWNYARIVDIFKRPESGPLGEYYEPCCLKSKPCYDCK